jgi:hypothetical protein
MDTTTLTSSLLQQLQGPGIQQIASRLGIDPAQAQSAVSSAVPLLLGTLGHNTQQPGGAQALLGALQNDHAGAASGGGFNLSGLLGSVFGGGTPQADGAGILGHIFGGNTPQAASGLSQATGLDSSKSGQLLEILAPIVLGFLAHRFLGGGNAGANTGTPANADQLGQALGQEHQQVSADSNISGLLSHALDQDGDGKFGVSDLLKIGGNLFGGNR